MKILLYIWISLPLFLQTATATAATLAELKNQVIADFGQCEYALDGQGDPVAETKVFSGKDCAGKPITICSLAARCTGGNMLPPEVAANATMQASCPVSDKCPVDPVDCMAVAKEKEFGGPAAIDGAASPARPRGDSERAGNAL